MQNGASWTSGDFGAGTVPQASLDKIAGVRGLGNEELKALVGQTLTAIVYDSDISLGEANGQPYGNLQGARYGSFTFTVLEWRAPVLGTSTSSLVDLKVRVEAAAPTNVCGALANPPTSDPNPPTSNPNPPAPNPNPPASNPNPPASNPSEKISGSSEGSLSAGAVVGIVVGAAAAAALAAVAIGFAVRSSAFTGAGASSATYLGSANANALHEPLLLSGDMV